MYDSGGKFPRGIISGVAHHEGNYYDCVEVLRDNKKDITFQGQYCVIPMEIFKKESKSVTQPVHNAVDNYSCIEDHCKKIISSHLMLLQRNHSWIDKQEMYWALCIPSSCTHSDLKKAMNKVLVDVGARKSLDVCVTMTARHCAIPQSKTRTLYEDIFILTIFTLSFLCFTSTIYDYYTQQNTYAERRTEGLIKNTFLAFSMKRNYEELVVEPSESDGMRILYGIRVISAMLIIAFHRIFFTNFAPLINPDFMISFRNKASIMLFRSGEMAVDTFFTISAFLHMHSIIKQQGKFSLTKHVFKRYMRLTPVAAFAIACEVIMIDNMNGYPLWEHVRYLIQRPCSENWMPNMLYVNNFETADEMCLVNAWYLGADMQLYVLSIPVIIMVIKYSSLAPYIFGILAFISIAVPFAITLKSDVPPVLLSVIDKNIHPLVRRHAEILYWPTYCRAGAYIVGLIAALLYHQMKVKKFRFSKIVSWPLLLSSFTCCFGPLYYSTYFHDKEYLYGPIEAALFASTNRFLWGVGISVFILHVATRAEGILHSFLGHKYFIVLGKVTYSSLLANLVINVYFLGSGLQPIYLSVSYYVTTSVLDVFFTYLLGILIYLIIEQPFRNQADLICNGFQMKGILIKSTRKSQ